MASSSHAGAILFQCLLEFGCLYGTEIKINMIKISWPVKYYFMGRNYDRYSFSGRRRTHGLRGACGDLVSVKICRLNLIGADQVAGVFIWLSIRVYMSIFLMYHVSKKSKLFAGGVWNVCTLKHT